MFFCRMMALREEKVIFALGLVFAEELSGSFALPKECDNDSGAGSRPVCGSVWCKTGWNTKVVRENVIII